MSFTEVPQREQKQIKRGNVVKRIIDPFGLALKQRSIPQIEYNRLKDKNRLLYLKAVQKYGKDKVNAILKKQKLSIPDTSPKVTMAGGGFSKIGSGAGPNEFIPILVPEGLSRPNNVLDVESERELMESLTALLESRGRRTGEYTTEEESKREMSEDAMISTMQQQLALNQMFGQDAPTLSIPQPIPTQSSTEVSSSSKTDTDSESYEYTDADSLEDTDTEGFFLPTSARGRHISAWIENNIPEGRRNKTVHSTGLLQLIIQLTQQQEGNLLPTTRKKTSGELQRELQESWKGNIKWRKKILKVFEKYGIDVYNMKQGGGANMKRRKEVIKQIMEMPAIESAIFFNELSDALRLQRADIFRKRKLENLPVEGPPAVRSDIDLENPDLRNRVVNEFTSNGIPEGLANRVYDRIITVGYLASASEYGASGGDIEQARTKGRDMMYQQIEQILREELIDPGWKVNAVNLINVLTNIFKVIPAVSKEIAKPDFMNLGRRLGRTIMERNIGNIEDERSSRERTEAEQIAVELKRNRLNSQAAPGFVAGNNNFTIRLVSKTKSRIRPGGDPDDADDDDDDPDDDDGDPDPDEEYDFEIIDRSNGNVVQFRGNYKKLMILVGSIIGAGIGAYEVAKKIINKGPGGAVIIKPTEPAFIPPPTPPPSPEPRPDNNNNNKEKDKDKNDYINMVDNIDFKVVSAQANIDAVTERLEKAISVGASEFQIQNLRDQLVANQQILRIAKGSQEGSTQAFTEAKFTMESIEKDLNNARDAVKIAKQRFWNPSYIRELEKKRDDLQESYNKASEEFNRIATIDEAAAGDATAIAEINQQKYDVLAKQGQAQWEKYLHIKDMVDGYTELASQQQTANDPAYEETQAFVEKLKSDLDYNLDEWKAYRKQMEELKPSETYDPGETKPVKPVEPGDDQDDEDAVIDPENAPIDIDMDHNEGLLRAEAVDPAEARLFLHDTAYAKREQKRFINFSKVEPGHGLGTLAYNPLRQVNQEYYNKRFNNCDNDRARAKPYIVPTIAGMRANPNTQPRLISIHDGVEFGNIKFEADDPQSNTVMDNHLTNERLTSNRFDEWENNRSLYHPELELSRYRSHPTMIPELRMGGYDYGVNRFRPSQGSNNLIADDKTGYRFSKFMRDDDFERKTFNNKAIKTRMFQQRVLSSRF
jgi:hypothetical protein